MKKCYTCLEFKDLTNYTKNKQSLDGLVGMCKDCRAIYMAKRYKPHNSPKIQPLEIAGESWRDIVGYEGTYKVSTMGRVKSIGRLMVKRNGSKPVFKSDYILNGTINFYGYHKVYLKNKYNTKVHSVHRLVAQAFLENGNNLSQVNHIDSNRLNNFIDNLEWCSPRENASHGFNKKEYKVSIYTGLYYKKDRKKWCGRFMINKKRISFGEFDTEHEAALEYQKMLILHGVSNKYSINIKNGN